MTLQSDPLLANQPIIGLGRYFTTDEVDPEAQITWERRDARIVDHRDGSVAFEQLDVEVPVTWSLNATNILAQKYFRGPLGSPQRETSLRQVVKRIVGTITTWGVRDGYFSGDEAAAFADELAYLVYTQRAAFNSPVWFNIGVPGVPQQASACFILSVEDSLDSILGWYVDEGRIFKGGSGSGVNLSKLRGSAERLSGGGTASGPVSFMRGADASAGTIKSGGTTRRAAKMVVLDADHPDIEEFIWCKAREERKAHALAAAGFDMGLDGADSHSIQYQNANNSVRLSDAFMQAVVADREWELTGRANGSVVRTVRARELYRAIAEASWECADPGVQFDTTINHWHTTPNAGRINASNPCSEYLHLDNSACNLASLNLLAFHPEGSEQFDLEGFLHAVAVVFVAQEILVANADYPTEGIGENARAYRQLGLGYANLGGLLMAMGLAYDSDRGRALAASLTALMTGEAYRRSSRLAARMGPFAGFHADRDGMLRVLEQHRAAVGEIDEESVPDELLDAARRVWDEVCDVAPRTGVRNAQATVLAPTGTIGLLMDCDTTGIEPDLGLVKTKRLVGGGTMSIVNRTVPRALRQLGYDDAQVEEILAYIDEHHSVLDAPHLKAEHASVFACSMGDNVIHHRGHIRMMGAVQPFLSGGISKTVNLPEAVGVEEIEDLYLDAWRLGVKAVAIYRDNCKLGQPLATTKPAGAVASGPVETVERVVERVVERPVRRRMPRARRSRTFEFRVADCKGFVTVGEYDDGRPGEIFFRVSKQGSTLAGIMDAFAISLSHGLQYGVPLRAFVEAFVGMRFEPAGITDDPDLRIASSLIDYLFRRLAVEYLPLEERTQLNILTTGERLQPTLPGLEESSVETVQGADVAPDPPSSSIAPSAAELTAQVHGRSDRAAADAPMCMVCGVSMRRSGSCHVCPDCGTTSGCS